MTTQYTGFLNEYLVTDKDESDTANMYYGFQHPQNNSWYAQKITATKSQYVAGFGATSYAKWLANYTSVTYYDAKDIYSNIYS